jgi:S-(hydroxymethyl)glutathione dehydrogenase/alcohol dehydrogenase
MADTITTGLGVINNDARVKIGESVVIFGAGGIGLGAILGARLAGAYPIVAVDVREPKLRVAERVGATHCVLANGGDAGRAVREILGGAADVVIDGTGQARVLQTCFALTKAQGRCVGIGVMRFDQSMELNTLPLHFGKILTGSEGGASQPHLDIPRYLRLIAAGRMDLGGFVSHRVNLADINEAMAAMRAGEVIHCLIKF